MNYAKIISAFLFALTLQVIGSLAVDETSTKEPSTASRVPPPGAK